MSTKIDELFATLRCLITDQTRDLALAMAELRSVAAERDKLKSERDDFADALQRNCVQYVEKQQALIAERDKLKSELAVANEKMDSLACVLDGCRIQRNAAAIERDNARQSQRAAEADAAETESVNSDLRTVNRRLVANLAAAMERLNHAESILMQ